VSDILNAAEPEAVIPTDAELAAAQDGSDGLPPAAFPPPGEEITVAGTFHVYEEAGMCCCELIDNVIQCADKQGNHARHGVLGHKLADRRIR